MRGAPSILLSGLLLLFYADAALRTLAGVLKITATSSTATVQPDAAALVSRPTFINEAPPPTMVPPPTPPPPPRPPPLSLGHSSAARKSVSAADEDFVPADKPEGATAECAKHDPLLGNLYADLAPWVDRGLRIDEQKMGETINFVERHRGKWNSWVTDTLTPVLIRDGKVYLTLGPPIKDPTNYFWTVLAELQELASTTKLPDTELLLNFADTPVVFAADDGKPTPPGIPIFSYCKRSRYLDVLVPGYYTPDRVCREYRARANEAHPWPLKEKKAFARYTHFCKRTKQTDDYGRVLPSCARSYYAALAATPRGASRLDVRPFNVVNDTEDEALEYGRKLLRAGKGLSMVDHGRFAYLLDTDGFTSAYKLQQLLATNSLVLHHRSVWRAYYYSALHSFVHYVPLWRSSKDDVLRVVDWLREHDSIAQRVAQHGQRCACDFLTKPGRLCYWKRAIELYAPFLSYQPSLAKRPRAFPLERLNIMCRLRDGPNVCYYNIRPRGAPMPAGYRCERPVQGINGSFEECSYRGKSAAAI
jgi:hypothetical protein